MIREDFSPNISEQKHFVHGQINVAVDIHREALDRLAKANADVRASFERLVNLRNELQKIEGWEKEIESMQQIEVTA